MSLTVFPNPFGKRLQWLSDDSVALASLTSRVGNLENTEYEITYFESVATATGTVIKPTGSTIVLDQFPGGVYAFVSKIENGKPTGEFPQTSLGVIVDVSFFDALGNYTLSDTPSDPTFAIIYTIRIDAINYGNINLDNKLDEKEVVLWENGYSTYDERYAQIIDIIELAPVIAQIPNASLPGVGITGDRYLLSDLPNINRIAEWTGSWTYSGAPSLNNTVYVTNTLTTLRFDGVSWVAYQGSAILQNGNSFGSSMILGTNDAYSVKVKVNNDSNMFEFDSVGRLYVASTSSGYAFAGLYNKSSNTAMVSGGSTLTTINGGQTATSLLNLRVNSITLVQLVNNSLATARRTNIINPTGSVVFASFHNGLEKIGIGMGTTAPTARFEIQGATSDNTSDNVLFKDSSTIELFRMRNDGAFKFKGGTLSLAQTGYTTFTNLSTLRTGDSSTGTLNQLWNIVGTLVEDLKVKAIIKS